MEVAMRFLRRTLLLDPFRILALAMTIAAIVLAWPGLTAAQNKPSPDSSRPNATAQSGKQLDATGPQSKIAAEQKPTNESEDNRYYEVPITVFGLAQDSLGGPIAGAEIYLVARQPGNCRIAEGKTAADGKYRFERVPLLIKRADTNNGQDAGSFEVFGIAEGYA